MITGGQTIASRPVCGFRATSSDDIVAAGRLMNFGSNLEAQKTGGQIDAYRHCSQRIDRIGAVRVCVRQRGGRRDDHVQVRDQRTKCNDSPDSKGTGTAVVTFDPATKLLTWDINFDGLTGPPTMAHFHGPAAPGANAPVALMIGTNPTSPAKGSATLDRRPGCRPAGRPLVHQHSHGRQPRRRDPRPSREVSRSAAASAASSPGCQCAAPRVTDGPCEGAGAGSSASTLAQCPRRLPYVSSTTVLRSVPSSGLDTSTTSPALSQRGGSLRLFLTGVPATMTSAGLSVMKVVT